MNGLKKLFTNRITYLGILVIIVMTVLIGRLFFIQVISGSEYSEEARLYNEYKLPLDAPRGNIYDKNGVLLAGNRTAYKVYMINTNDSQDYRDRMYLELVTIFEKNGDQFVNHLADYLLYPPAWGPMIDEPSEYANKQAFMNDIVTSKADKSYFDTPSSAFNYLRSTIFNISEEYSEYDAYKIMILRFMTYTYGLDTLVPSVVGTDVCKASIDEITSKSGDFRGITTEETYFRYYVNSLSLGPVIGYVRAIDEEEYREKRDKGYLPDDVIGKIGLEKTYEDYLRGERGERIYYKMSDGTVTETGYTPPKAGCDIYLTLDIRVQQRLYESMEATISETAAKYNPLYGNFGDCNAGAAVVSDVNNGEVIAMVSYPGFDSNLFTAPLSDYKTQEQIKMLLEDSTSPNVNRCTQGTYPIGSMIKPIIAIASLEAGVTDASRIVECPGYITVSGRNMKCLSVHNKVDLVHALGWSCNIYFATVGIDAGIDNIDYWAKTFGLGEFTGIDVPEKKGTRSNPETMDIFEAGTFHKWNDSSTASTCIGQLYTAFTPIQVNRYIGALANGGTLYNMHLLRKACDSRGSTVYEKEIVGVETGVSRGTIDLIKQGMTRMVDYYSGLRNQLTLYPRYFLAGKTGTAQTGTNEQSSHGFYTGFAPYNDPQIALTLMLEHGANSTNTFPMIGAIFDILYEGSYVAGDKMGTHAYDRYSGSIGSGQRLGKWFDTEGHVN
ncbi:MAG: hypothetical protein K6G89_05025 [Clostridia bacterium]|nr:hypothetical protein [Clostridia bacterium]